jgi:hypothetical protein
MGCNTYLHACGMGNLITVTLNITQFLEVMLNDLFVLKFH